MKNSDIKVQLPEAKNLIDSALEKTLIAIENKLSLIVDITK